MIACLWMFLYTMFGEGGTTCICIFSITRRKATSGTKQKNSKEAPVLDGSVVNFHPCGSLAIRRLGGNTGELCPATPHAAAWKLISQEKVGEHMPAC